MTTYASFYTSSHLNLTIEQAFVDYASFHTSSVTWVTTEQPFVDYTSFHTSSVTWITQEQAFVDYASFHTSSLFYLHVHPAPLIAIVSVANILLERNVPSVPCIPVIGAGGVPPYISYSINPTLPTGMLFNTSSGQVYGTPTQLNAGTNYRVTITDYDLQTASASFYYRVIEQPIPPVPVAKYVRGNIVFVSTEASYGSGVALTGSTDNIELAHEMPTYQIDYGVEQERHAQYSKGDLKRVAPSVQSVISTIVVDAKGAGTSSTQAVNTHALLSACGLSASISASQLIYTPTPLGLPQNSVGMQIYGNGELVNITGSMGTFKLRADDSSAAKFEFTMHGIPSAITDTAPPARVFHSTAVTPPNNTHVSLSVDTYSPVVRKWTYNHDNEVKQRTDQNATRGVIGYSLGRRHPTLTCTIEAPQRVTWDAYNDYKLGTPRAISLSVGDPNVYNAYTLILPVAVLTKVTPGNDGSVATLELEWTSAISGLDTSDDMKLVFNGPLPPPAHLWYDTFTDTDKLITAHIPDIGSSYSSYTQYGAEMRVCTESGSYNAANVGYPSIAYGNIGVNDNFSIEAVVTAGPIPNQGAGICARTGNSGGAPTDKFLAWHDSSPTTVALQYNVGYGFVGITGYETYAWAVGTQKRMRMKYEGAALKFYIADADGSNEIQVGPTVAPNPIYYTIGYQNMGIYSDGWIGWRFDNLKVDSL